MSHILPGWSIFTCIALLATLTGCASIPKFTGQERVALVSFALDKSIVQFGAQPDNGPGLLDNKSDYYQFHQEAVQAGWNLFKTKSAEVFGSLKLVSNVMVEGNPALLDITKPVKISLLGAGLSDRFVTPEGLNLANLGDPGTAKQISACVGADALVALGFQASYQMVDGLSVGGVGGGQARMVLICNINVVRADGSFVKRVQLKGYSKEVSTLLALGGLGSNIPKKDYPRLFTSALDDLLSRIQETLGEL